MYLNGQRPQVMWHICALQYVYGLIAFSAYFIVQYCTVYRIQTNKYYALIWSTLIAVSR